MSDLLSNCCAADFDAFGYEKEEGIWQERCLNCGKLCEPIMLSYKDVANIHRCVKWNLAPIDDKPEEIEKHKCTCVHSKEWSGVAVDCPTHAQIKMPNVNVQFITGDLRVDETFYEWMQQITEAVNSLKGE